MCEDPEDAWRKVKGQPGLISRELVIELAASVIATAIENYNSDTNNLKDYYQDYEDLTDADFEELSVYLDEVQLLIQNGKVSTEALESIINPARHKMLLETGRKTRFLVE